eukprot:3178127-Pyramimonas_sp.AAC.1
MRFLIRPAFVLCSAVSSDSRVRVTYSDRSACGVQMLGLMAGKLPFAVLVLLPLAAVALQPQCEVCHLRNDHTLDVSASRDFTEKSACRRYADASCCSVETANIIKAGGEELYGEQYTWNRYDTPGSRMSSPEAWVST